ncbi:ABC transporter B family member 9-like [Olea europaea subsp. europaea]|uniref:ABC transporter B family member 9-like n=1 Tax=Olea europaea subsp. europaea TaxID=158383 RepID=A0A8S0SYC3_OLEEU|nr:ABC transporter B family member 9-like [Olea europaea subsp. europaea]
MEVAIGRMFGDTILIQEAIGEKAGKFIQFMSTFIGGFIIAFCKGWHLSLVSRACIPALIIAGGSMSLLMMKMWSQGQVAYAEAGYVVEQTIGAIRMITGTESPCINAFAAGQAAVCKMFEAIERKPNIDTYDGRGIVLEDMS